MIFGGQGPTAPLVAPAPPFLSIGKMVTLEEVSTLPFVFVALQVNLPPSSGKTSLMVTLATPFLYFTSIIPLDLLGSCILTVGALTILLVESVNRRFKFNAN